MESTNNNSNNNNSTAAKLQSSVLQLPKPHTAHLFVCRGLLRSPLHPLPDQPTHPNPCGGSRLRSYQPLITVSTIPCLWLTFHHNRELPWPQASFWASGFRLLPLPHPALLPCPAPRLSLWPIHPQPPPEWLCSLPGLLQLRWLQLPCWAVLLQFSVTDGEASVQTRIWSSPAILLKALLLQLSLNSSSHFFSSLLSHLFFSLLDLQPPLLSSIPPPCLFPSSFKPTCSESRGLLLYTSLCCTISLSISLNINMITQSLFTFLSPMPCSSPTPTSLRLLRCV